MNSATCSDSKRKSRRSSAREPRCAVSERVLLYDTTVRDGTQREGISLSCDDKLRVLSRLDALGVAFVEGGWPGSNPKDAEFFARAGEVPLERATLVAFGATRRPNMGPD